jgi:hypothetical protein
VDSSIEKIHLTFDMFQELSMARLAREFYLGEVVDASIENIHHTITMFQEVSQARLACPFNLGEGSGCRYG